MTDNDAESHHDDATAVTASVSSQALLTPQTGGGSVAVRTFMFAMSSDAGPRLLAFRISNMIIGRLPDNHLAINHGSVSRRHATLSVTPQGIFIEDMGSQNGTTINGNPVRQRQPIRPGDVIRIGHVPLFYFGFIRPEAPPQPEFVDASILINPTLSPM